MCGLHPSIHPSLHPSLPPSLPTLFQSRRIGCFTQPSSSSSGPWRREEGREGGREAESADGVKVGGRREERREGGKEGRRERGGLREDGLYERGRKEDGERGRMGGREGGGYGP